MIIKIDVYICGILSQCYEDINYVTQSCVCGLYRISHEKTSE